MISEDLGNFARRNFDLLKDEKPNPGSHPTYHNLPTAITYY
jgi:hypothetical protein